MSTARTAIKTYDKDYYGWTNEQIAFLKKKDFSHLDMINLIEEIKSLGNSKRDKLVSHLRILLMHMLKVKYQPNMHSRSWDLSIRNSHDEISDVLEENPSLKSELNDVLIKAYRRARLDAAIETGLHEKTFPVTCPWELEEILG